MTKRINSETKTENLFFKKQKKWILHFLKENLTIQTSVLFSIILLGNLQASYVRYPFLLHFTPTIGWQDFFSRKNLFIKSQKQEYNIFDKYLFITVSYPEGNKVFKVNLPPSTSQQELLEIIKKTILKNTRSRKINNSKLSSLEKKNILETRLRDTIYLKKLPNLLNKYERLSEPILDFLQEEQKSYFQKLNNYPSPLGSVFFCNDPKYAFDGFPFQLTNLLYFYIAIFPPCMFLNILIETEKYKKSSRLTKAIIKKSHQNKKRLKDLAGIEKIQPDLKELIYLLRSSKKTSQFTNRLQSKGFLFVGPPGTGKTLLAQAIAGTAGVTLYATVASEFIDGQKGIGCCRLRDLFEKAKNDSPSIIFIDEIDTLAKAREGRINSLNQQTTDEEKIQIFTEFLVQMDGFSKQENIIIIGATNFCENLDPAFLRPGRFDRLFQLESPNQKTRVSILRLHVNKHNKKRGENIIKWAQFAQLTAGFTGADLSAMVNESLLYAIRTKNRSIHDTQTLEHGFKRIATYSGSKNEIGQTEVFSKIQDAYYKASKQLFATYFKKSFQKHFLPPIFFFHLENRPKNQRYLRLENEEQKMQFDYLPKKYLEIQLIEYLIGIATESLMLNKISSEFWLSQQGEKDMQKATNLIHKMVSDYAMEMDHFFFEKSYNTGFEKDWGEFWSLFQKEWNNYLQDKKDRGIKMDWRFFESWAWLETNQIYTQRSSFLWNESILDKNKESLLPDLYYQPQQNRIIGLDELLKNYLMKSYYRAVCLVKKEMDYLDLMAHQILLKE